MEVSRSYSRPTSSAAAEEAGGGFVGVTGGGFVGGAAGCSGSGSFFTTTGEVRSEGQTRTRGFGDSGGASAQGLTARALTKRNHHDSSR